MLHCGVEPMGKGSHTEVNQPMMAAETEEFARPRGS